MNGVIHSQRTHWACSAQNNHGSALPDSHGVVVFVPVSQMEIGFKACNHTGQGLYQGPFKKTLSPVGKQAAFLHGLIHKNNLCCLPAHIRERIPQRERICPSQIGLSHKFIPRFVKMLPFLSHSLNYTAEFMAHNYRILCQIIRQFFMSGSLICHFICGHTEAVRYDTGLYLIFPHNRKLEFFQP